MASRSESKAQKAIEDLHRDNAALRKDSVAFVMLDLGDLKSVAQAADNIKSRSGNWTFSVRGSVIRLNYQEAPNKPSSK